MDSPDATGASPAAAAGAIERAGALTAVGRDREAAELLRAALATSPGDADLLGKLAACHLALGEPEPARAAAEALVRARPEKEWGYRLLALAAEQRADWWPMLHWAREARRLAPEHPWPLMVLIRALLASGRRCRREAETAAADLLRMAPDAAESHRLAAEVAAARRAWREADGHARRAIALAPQAADPLATLAEIQFRVGRKLEALETMHRALLLDPESVGVRRSLVAMIDDRFRVRLLYYALVGLALPAVYLLALAEILYKVLLRPLQTRLLSPPLREIVRRRLRLRRVQACWQVLLLLALLSAPVWLVLLALDPGRATHASTWTWAAGAGAVAVLAGYRLYRLERSRHPLL
jgi:tetratricopeptide (TPR) repeat protein